AQPAPAAGGAEPDLILVNARVLTSDAAAPRAEAFAVKNGRFTAVGSTGDVRNLATSRTPVDDAKLDRPLTRKDLDEATTEHPVSVAHRGGHTNFYNSKAFELAGITADTPDPP